MRGNRHQGARTVDMLARIVLIAMSMICASAASAQASPPPAPQTIVLWPQGAPGSQARRGEPEESKDYWVKNIHNPTITAFPADPHHATGASIIVVPGGGHQIVVWTTEGVNVAHALNRMGITVFVLKYRLAREAGSTYSIERDAAGDLRRSIRWVRANAARFKLDPRRIGAMGFSAGGELVSLVADNPDPTPRGSNDPLDRISARPDFQVLVFPGPLAAVARDLAHAPPAFLVAGSRDDCCGPPTVALYEQLRKAGVSAELHMFAEAGHAFNLDESPRISIIHWPDRLNDWLADGGWLDGTSSGRTAAGH